MKKTKVVIPALGILLLSTAASVTGTVAWFSANDKVTASNMKVVAKVEQGIVISNETQDLWKESIDASYSTAVALNPTSTANFGNWYHATSDDANNAKPNQEAGKYESLTIVRDGATGAGFVDTAETADGYGTGKFNPNSEKAYYLLNKFYIKASSGDAISTTDLKVIKVSVTGVDENGSKNLDASLRIGIRANGGTPLIYAPVEGATTGYTVAAATAVTAKVPGENGAVSDSTGVTSIPNNLAVKSSDAENKAVEIEVFMYFEGEDPECKSLNLTDTLDNLVATVQFGASVA